MMTNIYILIDPRNGNVRYVGKANNVSQRYKAHLNRARKHQTHKLNWLNSLKKEELKPILEVVDVVSLDDWQFWETYWISQFKSWGYDLVNHTSGGDGCTFSNQTSFKKGHSVWLGKTHSEDTKRKMSKVFKGRKVHNSKEVIQLDLEGNELNRFESAHEAARQTSSEFSKICRVCRNERKTHNKYKWKYA